MANFPKPPNKKEKKRTIKEKLSELGFSPRLKEVITTENKITVVFGLKRYDYVMIEVEFIFDIQKQKPTVKKEIISSPNLRVFDNPILYEDTLYLPPFVYQSLLRWAYAIYKDRLLKGK